MTSRSRSLFSTAESGTGVYTNYTNPPIVQTKVVSTDLDQTCVDVVGNWKGVNPLTITTRQRYPTVVSGQLYNASHNLSKDVQNWPCTYKAYPGSPSSVLPAPTSLEKQAYATEILAKSNPSNPVVSIPSFYAELPETLEMIRDSGLAYIGFATKRTRLRSSLISQLLNKAGVKYATPQQVFDSFLKGSKLIAKANLTGRWSIRPLISDISKLLAFQADINRRLRWFQDLQTSGNIRRSVTLKKLTVVTVSAPFSIESSAGSVTGVKENVYKEHIWGCGRWSLPSSTILPVSFYDSKIRAILAKRLVVGGTDYEMLAAAWEVMPWSWFIDWFTGFGSFIRAKNNTLSLTPSHVCLMRTVSNIETHRITSISSWLTSQRTGGGGYIIKTREGLTPTAVPVVRVPVLSGGQWSVLGSLATLRAK